MMRVAALGLYLLSGFACDLIGPSCLARQERGEVTTFTGEVAPGQIAFHHVPYWTEGSQNDVRVSSVSQGVPGASRLSVFATKADCTDFKPPPAVNGRECSVLGSAGSMSSGGEFVNTLHVTHGRGNPEVLGSPAQYKLWIVADSSQRARYTIVITWFYGSHC